MSFAAPTNDDLHTAFADFCREATDPALFAWPMGKLLCQRERYIVAYRLIHDAQTYWNGKAPAPTLAGLTAGSPMSPRQTAAVVRALRAAGLVFSRPDEGDRRRMVLLPSASLIRTASSSMVAFVRAGDRLDGRRRPYDLTVDAPRQAELLRRCAEALTRRGVTLLSGYPAVNRLAGRDGGYAALTLMLAGIYSPAEARPVTAARLSAHLALSRSHAAGLIALAQSNGELAIDKRKGAVTISDAFRTEFEAWFLACVDHYRRLSEDL